MGKVHAYSILTGLLIAGLGCNGNGGGNTNSEPGASTAVTPPQTAAGANSPAQQPAPAPDDQYGKSADNKDPRPLLVCFGDSLTAGAGTDPGQSYPDYLQTDLDKLHYHYRVDNEGISGNTTKDGLERLPQILALHPAVVVVEFGGNDGLRGLRIEDSRANLDKIVGTLTRAGIKVALAGITLPPNYGEDYIQKFNETYRLIAQKYHAPMLPFLLKNVYGVAGMMQEDMTHPTARGNVIVARNVMPLVVPLLKK
jgi:acyl-CoA thioesterase-1